MLLQEDGATATMKTLSHYRTRICLLLVCLLLSASCYAQSCALCYTQAASSGNRIIKGLRSGILVLIVPPMFMSVGITVLAYRKRNRFRRDPSDDSSPDGW
jgi:hypothetical protein